MTEALNPELSLQLRVQDARMVADDIREFELVAVNGDELGEFTPGSHLLIQTPSGVTRRYSLASAPSEREHYVIAVKREANGRGGSISAVDDIRIGDLIHASAPRNEFELSESAPSYLFIAGGIGITPIRSMIRHVQQTSDKPFRLVYLSRQPEMTAYRDEFAGAGYRGKSLIHHDYGDPEKSFDLWAVLEKPKGHVYCCGPKPLMDAVRDMTGHWSTQAVHFEDFAAGKAARAADDKPFVVRYGAEGPAIDVAANQSILDALRARGLRIPSSCESGTCGSCRMRLLAGEADHRDFVLSDSERLREIMVCVSRAHTPELTVSL